MVMSLTGCTDNSYDLSDVDLLMGFGADELALPGNNSTKEIQLDKVLKLNDNDYVHIDENGDYYLAAEGKANTDAHPMVDQIVIEGIEASGSIMADLGSITGAGTGTITLPKEQSVSSTLLSFETQGDTPSEVKSLSELSVETELLLTVKFSDALSAIVPSLTRAVLIFPDYIELSSVDKSNASIDGNRIVVTNVPTNKQLQLKVTASRLKNMVQSATLPTTDNYVVFGNGKVSVKGKLDIEVSFNKINLSALPAGEDCRIDGNLNMGAITVTEARGRFTPSIKLSLGDTEIGDVPDFLTDEGVVIDLYNPQVRFKVSSDLDMQGVVKGALTSYDAQGNRIGHVDISPFHIHANGTTQVCFCRQPVEVEGYQTIVVPGISSLISTIPHRITFDVEAIGDDTHEATVRLGHRYTVTAPAYAVYAPLAFAEKAVIIYRDTLNGWNDDLKDLSLTQDSYVLGTAEVENTMPAYLHFSAYAIDKDGQRIPDNRIAVTVDKEIAPSADGKPVTTPVEVRVVQRDATALRSLDGLCISVEGTLKGDESLAGKTLNAYHHLLKLKNIQLKVVGKVIVDLNDDEK